MGMPSKVTRGWFEMSGRPGTRNLADQLIGLDWLFDNCAGKTVLDVGCAEGLISLETLKRGALTVHGIELVPDRVWMARKLAAQMAPGVAHFEVGDMEFWRPKMPYDIVIALAILHKLKDPGACAAALAECAKETVVLRLPPDGAPTICDRRSGMKPHRIGDIMRDHGFHLHLELNGHLNEWVGVYRRVRG